MAGFRLPGALCAVTNSLPIDTGTLVRGVSPRPGSVGVAPGAGAPSSAGTFPGEIMDDAITLYRASPTGKGTPNLSGPSDYMDRFKDFASKVDAKLAALAKEDRLIFADLGGGKKGQWGPDWPAPTKKIMTNNYFQPDPVGRPADYLEDLAMTALELVHEGLHSLVDDQSLMEELNCRYLEYSFYKDLMNGVTFSSRVTGKHEI